MDGFDQPDGDGPYLGRIRFAGNYLPLEYFLQPAPPLSFQRAVPDSPQANIFRFAETDSDWSFRCFHCHTDFDHLFALENHCKVNHPEENRLGHLFITRSFEVHAVDPQSAADYPEDAAVQYPTRYDSAPDQPEELHAAPLGSSAPQSTSLPHSPPDATAIGGKASTSRKKAASSKAPAGSKVATGRITKQSTPVDHKLNLTPPVLEQQALTYTEKSMPADLKMYPTPPAPAQQAPPTYTPALISDEDLERIETEEVVNGNRTDHLPLGLWYYCLSHINTPYASGAKPHPTVQKPTRGSGKLFHTDFHELRRHLAAGHSDEPLVEKGSEEWKAHIITTAEAEKLIGAEDVAKMVKKRQDKIAAELAKRAASESN